MNAATALSILSGAELNAEQQEALLRLQALVNGLQVAKRYGAHIVGGCECCGTWIEYEEDNKHGDWVKHEYVDALLNKDI